MDKITFTKLVREFKFKDLFNQMGWDNASGSFETDLKGTTYNISVICEKSGFRFLQCSSPIGLSIPPKNDRLRIQSIVKRRYYEHMLIFIDETRQKQVWQYAYKPMGKPLKTIITEYYISQDPQLLYQRTAGLVFNIDEHENITLVDVTKRLNATIDQNSEKVTKKFYDGFKKQHTKFLSFMTGITDEIDRNWYASVMLNRLMFCYFIQKRGFLDNNIHYLMNKLQDGQLVHGRDQFYSFYRNFLLQLFHDGLGSPDREQLTFEFGKIPYLNGGIFSVHELETKYEGQIQISDAAFESLFNFFEEYYWHLDTNVTATGKDINPDVIGYIFEKYINDRAQMGAYYTKEDITDYIGKNTILPYLFDEVQRKYSELVIPESEIWQKAKRSEDLYIYNAVKYGINSDNIWYDLPEDIKAGLNPEQENLVELRRRWNRPAPTEAALPTEIWREVIARRQRYIEVKKHISSGEITQINDFITYNLDIRQFALDLIYETDDPKLVFQFYNALKSITILDPTCGSGAFLFAAMNILEDLYEACINRMRDFVHDNPGHGTSHMKKELDYVDNPSHPNLEYFIYKSIILNNLYGVDIMNEAVEIAKLRLFLKLVACVDPDSKHPNYGLEPLPDIDFNIRCGNTLVGYASQDELDFITSTNSLVSAKMSVISSQSDLVSIAFDRFRDNQLIALHQHSDLVNQKNILNSRLSDINNVLNSIMHLGIAKDINVWKSETLPFHWFIEFHKVMQAKNGFDVIIGNPPYVTATKYKYTLSFSSSQNTKYDNIYAYFIDRSLVLLNSNGKSGMIVPVSLISGLNYRNPSEKITQANSWISSFSNRPGKLFKGVEQRLVVYIMFKESGSSYITKHMHWREVERENLFDLLEYSPTIILPNSHIPLKTGNSSANSIAKKIYASSKSMASLKGVTLEACWFHDGPTYWIRALPFNPVNNNERSNHYHLIKTSTSKSATIVNSLLLSSSFYFHYKLISNCRDFSEKEMSNFRYQDFTFTQMEKIETMMLKIHDKLKGSAKKCSRDYDGVLTDYYEYYPANAKDLIDAIDLILAENYGLSYNELDYIINYDIKYRMGTNLIEGDDNGI